jgi:hypothetical protein
VTLPARAAAIRGDDYQHAIGVFHACRVLTEPDVVSVSVEDAHGGAFDDVVVRMRPGSLMPHQYIQIKSSNYNNQIVDEKWLLTAKTAAGRSPLQHFHDTWHGLRATGEQFDLTLLSNRNFSETDDLLSLIDRTTETVPIAVLKDASPRTKVGRALKRWASHLEIDVATVLEFISDVHFVHGEGIQSWVGRCRPLMRNAGLRDDPEALTSMQATVRGWVTSGAGPQTRDDIRHQVAELNLLAREGTLVLAVHAIDRIPTSDLVNVSVDVVDCYSGDDAFERRLLKDQLMWDSTVAPRLKDARDALRGFRSRRIHVVGSMRLPMHFAVGRTLPDVGKWVLSIDQRDEEWVTSATRQPAELRVLVDQTLNSEGDLVVALALSRDPTPEIRSFLDGADIPAQRMLVLSSNEAPGRDTVPNAGWAADWVSQARDHVIAAASTVSQRHVRLFFACPAAVALFAGHQWNMVPTTTVFEHLAPGYASTFTFPG